MDLIKSKVKKEWKAICIDGSAFDSTQNATVMELLDTQFFKMIKPAITSMITKYKNLYPNLFRAEVDDVVSLLMEQATNLNNICFTELPGVQRV